MTTQPHHRRTVATSAQHTAGPSLRPALTVRIALWSATHRWPAMLAWLALSFGLLGLSLGLGGIRSDSSTSGGQNSQTESGRAATAMSPAGTASSEELDVVVTSASIRATDPAFRTTVEAIVDRLRSVQATVDETTGPALVEIADPYSAPATAGCVAPDNTSVRIVGRIDGDPAAIATRVAALEPVITAVEGAYPGYQIHAYDDTLVANEMNDEINRDMDGSTALSLPLTFLIMLLAFGALVAAGIPLLFAISALCAAFGAFGIFSQNVEPVSPFAAQVIMLIGLAVAVDYSLFMISRFRSQRRAGADRLGAIEIASATSGRAVLFSGIAVMISLAGLFMLPDSLFQSIAIGTIAVVSVSVAGSLVFLPAVLAILGDGIDRGRLPSVGRIGRRVDESSSPRPSVWLPIVRTVMRHPIAAIVVAAATLLVLASPTARLNLGEMDTSILPSNLDGVKAVEALQTHWPAGTLLRLEAVVTPAGTPAAQAAVDRLEASLVAIPGLHGPAQAAPTADGKSEVVSVVMSGGQNDAANWAIVRRVRSELVPQALAGSAGVSVLVGGGAATAMDQTQIYTDGMARVLLFVLAFSFVLLMLVFHSIAIPAKAILLNLLATGAAFGALVLVFKEGWFASLLGVTPTPVIQDWVPIFVFTVLFGLSMDYEVFILSRIKEAIDAGASSHDAVERGITHTAGTVTSAAAVMVVVFAIFLTLPITVAREMGLGLAVAIFVDATLIRCVLLPATMRLLGDWNWWLPPFLRWLPRITIETEVPEMRPAGGSPTHPAAVGDAVVRAAGTSMLPSGTGAYPR
jgi:uncharacterized membrane protein YdfJ with MMPL/SSD domain